MFATATEFVWVYSASEVLAKVILLASLVRICMACTSKYLLSWLMFVQNESKHTLAVFVLCQIQSKLQFVCQGFVLLGGGGVGGGEKGAILFCKNSNAVMSGEIFQLCGWQHPGNKLRLEDSSP